MSNIYISEPPTNGKVLLVTSCGDIDIELWSKEAPKTCRNFVQLCMEGYYDSTIFHRVIKNFIVQGGDPTGTGQGGESTYGKGFQDEFHQRLRYTRRGLVGSANYGPNTNGSQFFFTLNRTSELDGRNTIFGKVTGNTVYNMLKLAEVETDENDVPLYPPKIIKTEVLANPFDDIIPRVVAKAASSETKEKKVQVKSKATKNFTLLSFGEEAEDDEDEVTIVSRDLKIKSSHDALDDPKLSKEMAVETSTKRQRSDDNDGDNEALSDEAYNEQMKERVKNKLQKKTRDEKLEQQIKAATTSRKEDLQKEAKNLIREIRKSRKKDVSDASEEEESEETGAENSVMKNYKEQQQKYLSNQDLRKDPNREKKTLEMLARFQSKLQSVRETAPNLTEDQRSLPDNSSENKILIDDEDDEDQGDSWMSYRLELDNTQRLARDPNTENVDTFHIYDPRNPVVKRRREKKKGRH